MSKHETKEEWKSACLVSYKAILKGNPNKRLGFKYFDDNGFIECMLMNRAYEPIVCIGEWSDLERGEVYDLEGLTIVGDA